ncbi:transcriptional regulator, HxlR family [Klenkia soli]|uniref:Transcriptional regulator, HxlR family n=1 Tax=Klenkia soli TaxID=1052260 RepID=A0A1H0KZY1_9ACTN|nr:helix-turn-helix domain-containing protein [Klenkia soli]SDO61527.1 transcriptional regulator, HxlR family [Klenkia soli]
MDQHTAVLEGGLADRSRWRDEACPVRSALDVVGTRSAMLLLREAYYGTRRFQDFAARVRITDAVAAARLRELVEVGVLTTVPYREPGTRTRHEYVLTDSGRDLLPVVLGLFAWGSRHRTPDGRGPLELHHRDCGGAVRVEVRCEHDHPVPLGELAVSPARGSRLSRGAAGGAAG